MNTIIIEDEDIIARVLENKIRKLAPDLRILAVLPSLKTALRWLGENVEPDLILMDIQLNDGVSFEIFSHFTLKCPVIFTTAYDEYAIRAFKVNGADYLLKPIKDNELSAAIDKCRHIVKQTGKQATDMAELIKALAKPSAAPRYKEKFIVHFRNQWVLIDTKDIACFSKETLNYVYLFNGEKFGIDNSTLEEIEDLIDPRQFYRANRQFIINIEAVRSVKPVEGSKLIIRLKAPNEKLDIVMSRLKSPDFKKWLDR